MVRLATDTGSAGVRPRPRSILLRRASGDLGILTAIVVGIDDTCKSSRASCRAGRPGYRSATHQFVDTVIPRKILPGAPLDHELEFAKADSVKVGEDCFVRVKQLDGGMPGLVPSGSTAFRWGMGDADQARFA